MRRFLFTLLITALLLSAPPGTAAASQLRAGRSPSVEGPLTQTGRSCDGQTVRGESGVLGRAEICLFFFSFDPLLELDPLRDYGVAWVQMTFDAASNLCLEDLHVKVTFPEGILVHAHAPEAALAASRPKPGRVTLVASGGGQGLEEGSLSQRLVLFPDVFRGTANGRSAAATWRGRTGDKVALVLGAEVSWHVLAPLDRVQVNPGDVRLAAC